MKASGRVLHKHVGLEYACQLIGSNRERFSLVTKIYQHSPFIEVSELKRKRELRYLERFGARASL